VAGAHFFAPASGWSADTGAPPARRDAASAVSNTDLFLYGGRAQALPGAPKFDTAFRLGLADGAWASIEKGPSGRYGSFGASDGKRFFVWGGRDDNTTKPGGSVYSGTAWGPCANTGTPSARYASEREAGWAVGVRDGVVLVLGGRTVVPPATLRDGGIYDMSGGTAIWKPVPAWPSGEDHDWAAAVWTGSEFVIWGGRTGSTPTAKGVRYLP
jgi:hypothetical protein